MTMRMEKKGNSVALKNPNKTETTLEGRETRQHGKLP